LYKSLITFLLPFLSIKYIPTIVNIIFAKATAVENAIAKVSLWNPKIESDEKVVE